MKVVVKIGGAALDDTAVVRKCAHAIVELSGDGHQVAVIHGGGAELTRTMQRLGKKSEFINGLRVTDAETQGYGPDGSRRDWSTRNWWRRFARPASRRSG